MRVAAKFETTWHYALATAALWAMSMMQPSAARFA